MLFKKSRWLVSGFAAVSLLTVSGCVTDPNTGQKKVSRTAIGGVGGAVVGGLRRDHLLMAAATLMTLPVMPFRKSIAVSCRVF